MQLSPCTARSEITGIVVWGVAHLGKHLSGLAYRGQVVLVSHGAGHWTETILRTSKDAAQRLVCVSSVAAEAFQTPGVSVIHNGADGERCQVTQPRHSLRQEGGVTADEILIGYLGRFSWEKNPLAAALAVRELGLPFRAVYKRLLRRLCRAPAEARLAASFEPASERTTPLHVACASDWKRQGHNRITAQMRAAELLVDHGADVNAAARYR